MGLDEAWALRDICYLVFGVGSMAGVLYGIFAGRKRSAAEDTERIVRIDTNVSETRNDVGEIKADLRATNRQLEDAKADIAVLKSNCRKAHDRLDRHSERLDELEKGSK